MSASSAQSASQKKRVRQKRPAKTPPGALALGKGHSASGNRRAAIVLEVLAGIRTPAQAAEALAISINYYYVLERKALEGLVQACQPQPKGPPGPSPVRQLEKLQAELQRCQQECQRQAALVRATQRAVGLPSTDVKPRRKSESASPPAKPSSKRKKRRPRKASVRALKAVRALEKNSSGEKTAEGIEQTPHPAEHRMDSETRQTQEGPAHVPAGQETAGGPTC